MTLLFEISSFLFFLVIGSWNMRGIFTYVESRNVDTLSRMVQSGKLTEEAARKKVMNGTRVTSLIWALLTLYWAFVLVGRIWYR